MNKKIILLSALTIFTSLNGFSQVTNPSNAVTSTDYVGTSNLNDLVFKANLVEYARIKANGSGASSGFFGIGTTFGTSAPTRQLSVSTSSNLGTGRFTQTNTNFYNSLEFQNSGLGKIFTLRQAPTGATEGAGSFGFYDNTSGSYRMLIHTSGNIGINTTTPAHKLVVNGDGANGEIASFMKNGYSTFLTANSGNGAYNPLTVGGDNGIFWHNGSSEPTNGFVIAPWSGSSNGIRIKASGEVGIGIANPQARMDINGQLIARGSATIFDDTHGGNLSIGQNNTMLSNPSSASNLTISVPPTSWNGNGNAFIDVKGNDATPNNALYINTWSGRNTYINCKTMNPNGQASLPNQGGKVYLGVTRIGSRNPISPHEDAQLSVDGKVLATSIYVNTTSWADYVFADNYELPKLSEIEAFYKEHKHLPEIPSEKEVLENGINVAEMNILLLKKVEELTILLVEQNKRIEGLENEKTK